MAQTIGGFTVIFPFINNKNDQPNEVGGIF